MNFNEITKRIEELKAKESLTQEEQEELEQLENAKEDIVQLTSIFFD